MEWFSEMSFIFLKAVAQMLLHPLYYVGIFIIALQYYRQIQLERKLFQTKLHSALQETWRNIMWGWVAGLIASAAMVAIGATVSTSAVYWIWGLTILLVLVRTRYLCLAYAVGLIALLQYGSLFLVSVSWPDSFEPWARLFVESIQSIKMSTLLALVAVLHIIEAIFMRTLGKRMTTPLFMEGKRGKVVGAYQFQGFWPVPLFFLIPIASGADSAGWSPLLSGDLWQSGWTMAVFPIMIGFMDWTKTMGPRQKLSLTSMNLLWYSFIILTLAVIVEFWESLSILAGFLCLVLHEALVLWSKRAEEKRPPMFVHDARGLRILDVIPGSPAAELGIQAGEVLVRVNGIPVRTRQALHQALRANSAFCRLELLDLNGENKFMQRALFAGEHHQLGILLAPDDDTKTYVSSGSQPASLIANMQGKSISK